MVVIDCFGGICFLLWMGAGDRELGFLVLVDFEHHVDWKPVVELPLIWCMLCSNPIVASLLVIVAAESFVSEVSSTWWYLQLMVRCLYMSAGSCLWFFSCSKLEHYACWAFDTCVVHCGLRTVFWTIQVNKVF